MKTIYLKIILFILPQLVSNKCSDTTQPTLVGRWKEYQVETESGNKNGPDDIPFFSGIGMDWVFGVDSVTSYYENQIEWTLPYAIKGDTLVIFTPKKGTSMQSIIEKLDATTLILLDTTRQDVLGNERLRSYYKRQID